MTENSIRSYIPLILLAVVFIGFTFYVSVEKGKAVPLLLGIWIAIAVILVFLGAGKKGRH